MLKISDALQDIFKENPFLEFGFSNRLFNLSMLADFLQPFVKVRTKTEIAKSAIHMALSRERKRIQSILPKKESFIIDQIFVYSNLLAITFFKTNESHELVQKIYNKVQNERKFITISEGISEVTIILENSCKNIIDRYLSIEPKYKNTDIASVGIKFSEKYTIAPGLFYAILQQVTLQGINIIEISSTYTELILYIESRNTKIAFETLFQCFKSLNVSNYLSIS